jgi:acyl-CoA synthetase (AMP-forming)/AMP-acid ligase II
VIGIPDEHMGERVKAFIVLTDEAALSIKNGTLSESDIKHFCAEHLADYKVPRIYTFIDSIPRNSTGKVLKRLLS